MLGSIRFNQESMEIRFLQKVQAEREMVFGVQVEFVKRIYQIFSGNFLDSLKTHIDQAPRIQDASC